MLAPTSPLESKARALRLSYGPLLEEGLADLPEGLALSTRLLRAGARDEVLARNTAERVLRHTEPLITELAKLSLIMGRMEAGLPILDKGSLPRELARLVDPDAILLFHPDLKLPDNDPCDWPAIPLPANGRTCDLLRTRSVDTHIHLGGSLSPLFYWIPLMGGGLHLDSLRGLVSKHRGHADRRRWQNEVAWASWRRVYLARLLGERSDRKLFPWLADRLSEDPSYDHFLTADRIHRRVLAMTCADEVRRGWVERWFFPDPLRDPAHGEMVVYSGEMALHYAAGERRLLYGAARYLWGLLRCQEEDDEFEGLLRDYLLVRNSFHALLLHNRGSEGLLRFVESFGRRGFLFKGGGPSGRRQRRGRRRGRRRRGREMALALQRARMTAALDSQLLQPFATSEGGARPFKQDEPRALRRIEMRVSVPRLRDLPKTLNAWLEGIRRHLKPEDNLFARSRLSSQVGLLFHFNKRGNATDASKGARHAAKRLIYALERFPGLRSFVVGVDAAGFERKNNPRAFLAAFRHLRTWRDNLRPVSGESAVHLGWTFHVGEDVEDFLTGLRHLDETVSLLLPRRYEGGRLGHALVLGDDPRQFYTQRGMTEPPLGSHFLDLVWAWGRLTEVAKHGELVSWIKHQIRRIVKISGQQISDCYEAMALDVAQEPLADHPWLEEELLDRFFAVPGLNLSQPFPLKAEPAWLELLATMQRLLQRRVAKARICVEANPTSNLLIGGYEDYGALPYHRLTKAGIALSINTDDPGLFVTTLPGELEILYEAMEGKKNHREILTWLRERLFDAEQSTFLHHVPVGEAAWEKSFEALESRVL